VTIHALEVQHYAYPDLALRMTCGKGTYVRSLARDLGQKLGCGGYVASLTRTQVGPFHRSEALSLEASAQEAHDQVLPLEAAVAALPRLTLTGEPLSRLCHGQIVSYQGSDAPDPSTDVAIFNDQTRLAAIAHWQAEQKALHPKKILLPSPANR
jgi:tRNA pseudouridine55 synthase